jgi:hypothetical protein
MRFIFGIGVSRMKGLLLTKLPFLVLCALILSACGYGFAPVGEHIDKRIQKIYVEQFDNKTFQAEMENYIRSAFIGQVIQTSRFKVADSAESADAIIKGSIINLNMGTLSYRANTLTAEERASITLDVSFLDRESGKIIWSSKNITGNVDYQIDNNINFLPATRKHALAKLANDIAEKAFNLMMSGF